MNNPIETIYLLDNHRQGYYTIEFMRKNGNLSRHEVPYKNAARVTTLSHVLDTLCWQYSETNYHISKLSVFVPIRKMTPKKTNPLYSVEITFHAKTLRTNKPGYTIVFYRQNGIRILPLKIERFIRLDCALRRKALRTYATAGNAFMSLDYVLTER